MGTIGNADTTPFVSTGDVIAETTENHALGSAALGVGLPGSGRIATTITIVIPVSEVNCFGLCSTTDPEYSTVDDDSDDDD